MHRLVAAFAACLLWACTTPTRVVRPHVAPDPQPTGPIRAIRNVRIFDGTQMLPPGNVVFQGARILAVGAEAAIPAGVIPTVPAPAAASGG